MSSLFIVTQTWGWANAALAIASRQASAATASRKYGIIITSIEALAPYHSLRPKGGRVNLPGGGGRSRASARGGEFVTPRRLTAIAVRRPSPKGGERCALAIPSHALRPTIGARIVRALERPVRVQHDGSGVTHEVRIFRIEQLDIVPRLGELFDELRRKPGFKPQVRMRRSPGAAEQPARAVERLFERLTIEHVPSEQRGLGLRLTVPPHRAVGEHSAVAQRRERRVQRVERPPPRREGVESM